MPSSIVPAYRHISSADVPAAGAIPAARLAGRPRVRPADFRRGDTVSARAATPATCACQARSGDVPVAGFAKASAWRKR
jgi:hypothetical protein